MPQLPNVKIDYGNGALGQAIASADGLLCLIVVGAVAIADKFDLAKTYALRKAGDLDNLGITSDNNPEIYKLVKDFYTEATEGIKVHIIGYPDTLKMSDVLDYDNPYARKIIEALNGEVRGLFITARTGSKPKITKGFDADLEAAKLNAETLGDWATKARHAPIFVIIDGLSFSGDPEAVEDMRKQNYNRVGVVVGAGAPGSANQAIGLIAGRVAMSPVQRNIARTADGSLHVLTMYIGDKLVEVADVETLHDKGYITFRTFTGMSGYYITDDPLATDMTDDYNQLARRRVIDKAYRIAYAVLIEKLNDEIPVNSNGTMIETYARSFELAIENAIVASMTNNGELSTNPRDTTDRGVTCKIDRTVNVLATNKVNAELRVRPHGYSKYITVLLGFEVTQQS